MVSVQTDASAISTNITCNHLQKRVEYLEHLNDKLTKENSELKKKRKDPPMVVKNVSKPEPSSNYKRTKMLAERKKLFEKWVRLFNRELSKRKFTGYVGNFSVPIVDTSLWTKNEFENMFRGKGVSIQPLSNNTSPVYPGMAFKFSYDEIKSFFEDVPIPRQGYRARLFSNRGFLKTSHYGTIDCKLDSMDVTFDEHSRILTLSFNLSGGKTANPLAEIII